MTSKKNGTNRDSGVPGGLAPPQNTPPLAREDPKVQSVRFLACYAKIIILRYSRNIEYLNYYWKVPMWGTPLGGPPRGPQDPSQGPPGVLEFWKKLQKSTQIIYKIYMHQNIQNCYSNTHFGSFGLPMRGFWG